MEPYYPALSPVPSVGFGTAALGGMCADVVYTALEAGFRRFDTAEAPYWYDQAAVGRALKQFMEDLPECEDVFSACVNEDLEVSTKIPPWELTSIENIRQRARDSQDTILGFCNKDELHLFPLDIYYIHAPQCWKGWHPQCINGDETKISLREAWIGMEQVVAIDKSAKRIGLSNVSENELLDIIAFVHERQADSNSSIARMPDVVQSYADPFHTSARLRDICAEHGIEFVSYSTLGTQHTMRTRGGVNPVLGNPLIVKLAAEYNRSTAEIVLSWAMQRNMSIIPRSSNQEHILQLSNLIYNEPFLESDDLALIDNLQY